MAVLLLLWAAGIEQERGRENRRFPVEEGLGEPWVPQVFDSEASRHLHKNNERSDYIFVGLREVYSLYTEYHTKTRSVHFRDSYITLTQ